MRDPARIDRMLEVLREVWNKHPDLRLGQIVEVARSNGGLDRTSTFYVEDDALEEGLRIMATWKPSIPPSAPGASS